MYNQTILLGILVSLFFTEFTGYSAGLIIPGYLALNLHNPQRLLYTLFVAAASVALCRLLSHLVILYGRRRFAMLMLLTFFLGTSIRALGILKISTIGILLPGLIARESDRQGFLVTLLSLAVTTGITILGVVLCGHRLLL